MSVSFTVPGPVPSKSNFRWSNTKESRAKWQRIKSYEQEVGLSAMVAGAKKHSGKARVKVLLVNQKLDLDNSLKAPIDGLKAVAFEDDSPRYLDAVQVCWAEDSGPVRTEFRISWECE